MEPKWGWVSNHTSPPNLQRLLRDVLLDLIIVVAAYTLAFILRALTVPLDYRDSLGFIAYVAAAQVLTLYLLGAYHRLWSRTSGHSVIVIVNAVGLASVVVTLTDLIPDRRPLPVSVVIVAQVFVLFGVIAVRFRSRLFTGLSWRWQALWAYRSPNNLRVLIVGAGDAGQVMAWRLKYRSPHHDYQVVGFVDDDPAKQKMYVEGSPVLGTRGDIERLVEAQHVDLIVVAIHKITGADMRDILARCEATKALIKVIPDVFDLMNTRTNAPQLRDVQAEDLIGRNVVTRGAGIALDPVTGKVVLVTGAAGSIGSELSRQIVHFEPTRLILLDIDESGLHDLSIELGARFPQLPLVPVLADITVLDQVEAVFEQHAPQLVFHCAAYKHVPMLEQHPNQGIRTNIGGTQRLAQLARSYQTERFVLISSDKAVNPQNVMGATKRVCELILHALSAQAGNRTLFTSVRFGNVLGSRGSVVPTFARQIDSGGPVTVTHPDMTRYFMSIPEAANLVIHAACLTRGDDIFILRMGEVVRIVELAERMIRLRGLRPYVDIAIEFTGMRPGEKMHEELYDTSERPSDTAHPSIIELHSWSDDFDAAVFFSELDTTLAARFNDRYEALRQLRDLMHIHYNLTTAAD